MANITVDDWLLRGHEGKTPLMLRPPDTPEAGMNDTLGRRHRSLAHSCMDRTILPATQTGDKCDAIHRIELKLPFRGRHEPGKLATDLQTPVCSQAQI